VWQINGRAGVLALRALPPRRRLSGLQPLITEIHFHGDPHKNDPMYRVESAIAVQQHKVNGASFETGVFDVVLEPD
jgi:hypothetical protein